MKIIAVVKARLQRNPWTVGWVFFIGGGTAYELATIKWGDTDATLSGHVWDFLGIHPLIWFIAAGIAAWVIVHFFQRTWRRP